MEWLKELRDGLDAEFGTRPFVVTLATVDLTGWPHARMVVCRRIDDDGTIYVVSDARSQKNMQVRARPAAEFCFWLPTLRTQFRVSGDIVPVAAHVPETAIDLESETTRVRREAWEKLSPTARALFAWPVPGEARVDDDAAFVKSNDATSAPDNFEVLLTAPRAVERLDLNTHPHRRRRWMLETEWVGVDLNP